MRCGCGGGGGSGEVWGRCWGGSGEVWERYGGGHGIQCHVDTSQGSHLSLERPLAAMVKMTLTLMPTQGYFIHVSLTARRASLS